MSVENFHRELQMYGRASYWIPGVATVELSYGENPPPIESKIILGMFLRCVEIGLKGRNWSMIKNLFDIHGDYLERASERQR